MKSHPCVAVGGGLAGAACAIELARNGHHVIVLERTRNAHHKVCGEFLSVEAQALLEYLGVNIWALGATEVKSLHLFCGTEFPVVDLPFRAAGLSRFCLDEALLQAAANAGAEVVRGIRVTRLEAATDTILIHTPDQQLRASCIALATGKHDLRGCMRPRGSAVSFKLQLSVGAAGSALLRNAVHLTLFRGGYVGACLVEGGIVTICWVLEHELVTRIGLGWTSQAIHLSQQSGFLRDLLVEAKPLWQKPIAVAAIPYNFLRARVISQLIYPIGDQLAVIPSYTGEGMSIAFHSGIAAARAILGETTAGEFQQSMCSSLRSQMIWATVGNLLFSTSIARYFTAAICKALPWALPQLIQLVAGATRLSGFEPRLIIDRKL